MLYPLSYEGGDGAERGAKLGATARKPWGEGSSGPIGRSKVQLNQTDGSMVSVHTREYRMRFLGAESDLRAAGSTLQGFGSGIYALDHEVLPKIVGGSFVFREGGDCRRVRNIHCRSFCGDVRRSFWYVDRCDPSAWSRFAQYRQ